MRNSLALSASASAPVFLQHALLFAHFSLSWLVLSNSSSRSGPRAVLKSFRQTLQISFPISLSLSLSPSCIRSFAYDFWPTSFRRKKEDESLAAQAKIDEIRKCCCLARQCWLSRCSGFCYILFFTFFFANLLLLLLVLLNCKTYFGH